MCGDLDEDQEAARLENQLYARFLAHAKARVGEGSPSEAPADLAGYMEKLFVESLGRSVRDGEQAGEGGRYERLAMQPVVFARLAGFLAGHLAPGDDTLRKVIEALMTGYGEAEAMDHNRSHHHGDVPVRDHRH